MYIQMHPLKFKVCKTPKGGKRTGIYCDLCPGGARSFLRQGTEQRDSQKSGRAKGSGLASEGGCFWVFEEKIGKIP